MISQEDMRVLDGYANTFKRAVENGYARNFTVSQYRELNDVYEHITGHRYKADMGCPYCALTFIKNLGVLYFKAKQEQASLEAQVEESLKSAEIIDSDTPKDSPKHKKNNNNKVKSK